MSKACTLNLYEFLLAGIGRLYLVTRYFDIPTTTLLNISITIFLIVHHRLEQLIIPHGKFSVAHFIAVPALYKILQHER